MSTSLRAAQRALTRARMLDAAHTNFADKGYESTSIDDIARDAGATRTTFYLHFDSKATAALALWQERIDVPTREFWAELGPVIAALGERADPSDSDWFSRVLEYWETRGPLIKALIEARIVDPVMSSQMASTRAEVASIIAAALAPHSRFSDEELLVRAVAAFDLQAQLFMDWITDAIPHRKHIVISVLRDAWTALLV